MKKPRTILIIEDDPWFAEQHARTFETAGFQTKSASDGISGIAMLDKEPVDVVVLDVFLPGPNGLALLHEMKSYSDLSRLPVIVCTGSASAVPLDKLAPYGVVQVLDKGTMEPEDLVRAVRRALA